VDEAQHVELVLLELRLGRLAAGSIRDRHLCTAQVSRSMPSRSTAITPTP
jgi:hypothetical protein